MTNREFRLPDLGEGLPDAEIVRWLVSVGDTVTVNQPLVEVETAKALVEVPSPFAGTVVTRHAAEGETLAVGLPLVTIDASEDDTAGGPGEPGSSGEPGEIGGVGEVGAGGAVGRTPMLVGYGPRTNSHGTRSRRSRRAASPATSPVSPTSPPSPTAPDVPAAPASRTGPAVGSGGDAGGVGGVGGVGGGAPAGAAGRAGAAGPGPVLAKPPVRKLARDLGVDLRIVVGTGPHGTISRADVEAVAVAAATAVPVAAVAPATTAGPPGGIPAGVVAGVPALGGQPPGASGSGPMPTAAEALLATARYDPVSRTRRIPVTGVRRATARAMVGSAFTAPHVTEFVTVDVTETMAAKQRLAELPEFADVKLTPLLFTAKALLVAARRHPLINSRWDGDNDGDSAEIVVHDVVNLGIAVASPRGLLVPNIPDAGARSLADLARAVQGLVEAARSGRVMPADLRGGTITITNVGSLGVDTGTPILNRGEAAILALGAVREAPWVHRGELAVRMVAHLALSFDHRIVDGQLGSAVLADVAAILADPMLALAWS